MAYDTSVTTASLSASLEPYNQLNANADADAAAAAEADAAPLVVGRKVVYGTGADPNANVVYKYVRIPRPHANSPLARLSAAAAAANFNANGQNNADAALALSAVATGEIVTNTTAPAPAAGNGSAALNANGTAHTSGTGAKNATAAATATAAAKATVSVIPSLTSSKSGNFASALEQDLHFSATALALVFVTASVVGVALGVAYQSYSKGQKKADDGAKRFKAFALL